jgi:fucose permease
MQRYQTVFTLVLVYVIFAFLLNTVGVIILQSAGYFDATKAELSFLEGFKDLSIAITAFILAAQVPNFGFRRSLLFSLALVFIGCISMPLANTFWATKLLLLTVGVGFGLSKVAVYASVGLITNTRKDHASLLNLIEGFFVLGVLGGTLLFGLFIDPNNPKSESWLNVYWLVAGMCLIGFIFVLFMKLDESKAKSEGQNSPLNAFKGMIALAGRLLILVFILVQFLSVLIEQGINTWLPTFNKEVLFLNPQMAVIAATLFAGSAALGRLAASFVLKKIDWFPYLAFCVISMAALILLTLPLTNNLSPTPDITWASAPIAAYIFPLIGFFMGPIYPVVSSAVLSTLPSHEHAGATGLLIIFSALGGTFGSLLIGRVFDLFDGQTAFYLTLVPITCIFIALSILRKVSSRLNA